MATLQLRNVVKKYDTLQVIHGVDLDIAEGEFCVFVGPSGCGKSTLLRMIAGLESITEGEMTIDGERVNEVPASKRGLAMVFQSYALYPHMTVRQNLEFGLENIRLPKDQIRARVAEATRMLQIEPLLERRPKALSGGQRQRVAIGRAVVREPKILLFDEPLSNLDAELRVQMRVEIGDLHERLGNTMIYVTHDQVEAMTMADKIVVLRSGNVEQVGAPLALYNRPANRFVAGFIGSPRMNFIEVTVTAIDPDGVSVRDAEGFDYRAAVSGGGLEVGQPATLGIRPEHFGIGQGEGRPLKVEAIEQLGSESYFYGATASGQKLTAHFPGQTDVRTGDETQAVFRPEFLHLFAGEGERAQPRLRVGEEGVDGP